MKAVIGSLDGNSMELLFSVGESKYGLRLISADRFKYSNIDEQMREEGHSAWLDTYSGDKLVASFLLYPH
ncbi:MAG TPA: hypothetical protein VHQ22_04180 [Terriglobales bacterium]|nr:hypothetical protein [Terriglobales bacterium]